MVESQLRPNGIIHANVLDAMARVPRELFAEKKTESTCYLQKIFYTDEKQNRFLLPPSITGKMLQALDVQDTDIVLDIGCGAGYHSALLGKMADTIISIDTDKSYFDKQHKIYSKMSILNIVPHCVKDLWNDPQIRGPFDKIIISGAVQNQVPKSVLQQLSKSGKLVAIIMENLHYGYITLISRTKDSFTYQQICECSAPYLEPPSNQNFIF